MTRAAADLGEEELRAIGAAFAIEGTWRSAKRFGRGHINDTFLVDFEAGGRTERWVQQRINPLVFPDPAAVMHNVEAATRHLRARRDAEATSAAAGGRWEVLTLVPARAGGFSHRDPAGGVWRTYRYVAGARTYDTADRPEIARAAARAFGRFARELEDLEPSSLVETIPSFHDLGLRLRRLFAAAEEDRAGRAAGAARELDRVRERVEIASTFEGLHPALPLRVAHNDTKVNNVLLDDATGEGVCVLDLDTVMPGTLLYDYGDLVRTATSRAREDAGDVDAVHVEADLFEAVTEGYLTEAGRFALPLEVEHLLFGARFMTLIIGVRFLTDHLEGDPYFRTTRPGQNLDRCRTQLRLLASLEEQDDRLREIVHRAAARG